MAKRERRSSIVFGSMSSEGDEVAEDEFDDEIPAYRQILEARGWDLAYPEHRMIIKHWR